MNNQNLIKDFLQKGYFQYDIPSDLEQKINKIANLWRLFYAQSLSVKQRHVFNDYSGGYEYKGPNDKDYKENFHLPLCYQMPRDSTAIDMAFIRAGKELIKYMENTVWDMTSIMSDAVGVDLADSVCGSTKKWVLRFLYYPPQERPFLAVSHIDKSVTVHLYEDAPGLQILWNGVWQSVFSQHQKIHGYFGMSGQFYSESQFPALCHRVVTTPQTQNKGRTAIVLFCDFGEVMYNKKTFGSTQQIFANGENYGMPFDQFSKYFIKI